MDAARAFFIWTSVYNLFVVSVFWSFMADLYTNAQAKRLFGFIAAGGTTRGARRPGAGRGARAPARDARACCSCPPASWASPSCASTG